MLFPDLSLGYRGRNSHKSHGADANGSRSHPGEGASGRSFNLHDDSQATETMITLTSLSSQADTKPRMSDSMSSGGRTYEAREKYSLAQKPVRPVLSKLSRVEKSTEPSVEVARKATAVSPVSQAASVHL